MLKGITKKLVKGVSKLEYFIVWYMFYVFKYSLIISFNLKTFFKQMNKKKKKTFMFKVIYIHMYI